jgi:membrane protein DedA with SNARE-associated domain
MAIASFLLTYRYPAIFIGSFLEGPTIMMLTGFFLRLGYFNFFIAYALLLLGDLVGDLMWYGIGYFGLHRTIRRFGRFFDVSDEVIEKIKIKFRKHEVKILFGSKLTTGFGFSVAIMMTAGMARVPLRKFAAIIFSGGLAWALTLMTTGYFFGHVYLQVEKGFRMIFLFSIIVIISAAFFGFSRHMKKTFLKNK